MAFSENLNFSMGAFNNYNLDRILAYFVDSFYTLSVDKHTFFAPTSSFSRSFPMEIKKKDLKGHIHELEINST